MSAMSIEDLWIKTHSKRERLEIEPIRIIIYQLEIARKMDVCSMINNHPCSEMSFRQTVEAARLYTVIKALQIYVLGMWTGCVASGPVKVNY